MLNRDKVKSILQDTLFEDNENVELLDHIGERIHNEVIEPAIRQGIAEAMYIFCHRYGLLKDGKPTN